ncbi:MAG: 4Fe-4S binding protein [Candidatus Aegiribacteria sp.]|nr:4Fe-4S binding protein [Candidatus Aegiribacteria sp.]
MGDNPYRSLAEYLDKLPGGFQPSETGAEIRLLKRLFTPEEAALAIHLSLDRECVEVISGKAGLTPEEVGPMLSRMAHRGLIFSALAEDGSPIYQAVPFVVGIWEFQVNHLTMGLIDDVNAYWSTMKRRRPVRTIPQMRTIPIGESIEPQLEAYPHEHVVKLLDSQDRFAVAPCICRLEAKMDGKGCDALVEACLMFGDWADYYVREGKGRAINRSEVLDILAKADADNLVLQPSNSRNVVAICCCCSCCCGVLQSLIRHPKPSEAVFSPFTAEFDCDLCVGCGICIERCRMNAFTSDGDKVEFDPFRCIGCGLCVTTCPAGALTLARKPDTGRIRIPDTMDETWQEIVEAREKALEKS